MPSSPKKFMIVLAFALSCACQTAQNQRTEPYEVVDRSRTYLDWLPLEARLADQGTPLDEATRDQVVALKIAVEDRAHELTTWVVPLLSSYLPRGDKLRGRVVFDLGRAQPIEVTDHGVAYIDVGAPEWKTDPERLWFEVVGALYRSALLQALPVRLDEPKDADAFADRMLQRLMVDGLATYVTAQGAPLAHSSTPDRALMLRDEKSERFQRIERLMATARTAMPAEILDLWRKVEADEPRTQLLGVAGAAMAEAIEAREGRVELLEKVSLGQRAFYNSYMEGRPGSLLSFHLPPEAVAPVDELPPPARDDPDSAH